MRQPQNATPTPPASNAVNVGRLIKGLIPDILNAGSFQLSLQLLAWRLKEAFDTDGAYVFRFSPGPTLTLQAQAGLPPGNQGFERLQATYAAPNPNDQLSWTDTDETGQTRAYAMLHDNISIADDHTLTLALAKDTFKESEKATFTYLTSILAPVLASALRQEQLANEVISVRRLVHDTKAEQRAKSAFLSRMSHDLRTPLSVILGFAQLLEDEGLDKTQEGYVDYILQAGRRLLTLINQVLELTDVDSGKLTLQLQPLRVADIITKCVNTMAPQAREKNIKISTAPAEHEDPWILADADRVEQILYNLLSNAIKFNTERGSVIISTALANSGRVQISVRDSGPGLPNNHIPRIFEPFERLNARSDTEGSGLGLALSKALTQALGGNLTAESKIGKGSTFTVELPAAKQPKPNPA